MVFGEEMWGRCPAGGYMKIGKRTGADPGIGMIQFFANIAGLGMISEIPIRQDGTKVDP
jgi:hypothetical protein